MNAPLRCPNPLPPLQVRLIGMLCRWLRRSATRRELAALSREQLRDIGISPAEAWREARRPFWRAGEHQSVSLWWQRAPLDDEQLDEQRRSR